MNSREAILEAVRKNQPHVSDLPHELISENAPMDVVEAFTSVLHSIGGTVVPVKEWVEVSQYLNNHFDQNRWVNLVPEVGGVAAPDPDADPHQLENVSLSILRGQFGVAENGAVWITADAMGDRALPFICEHLAIVIHASDIFPTMHDAYQAIDLLSYDFGTFIAGPSKTADIEQSLVLGAHGPKSLTLFLLETGSLGNDSEKMTSMV